MRSDEACCYHNTDRIGIEVVRYDYSEPQYGKDVCDRILCPMKAAIRRYCNEGHDIVTLQDMHTALKKRPVQGTTAAVCCINEDNSTQEIKKITKFSAFHNFEFNPDGLRVWKAYNIGHGKLIAWEGIIVSPQGATRLKEEEPFFPSAAREMKSSAKRNRTEEVDVNGESFECPDPQLAEEFQSRSELDTNLSVFAHPSQAKPTKMSMYDEVRIDCVKRFQTISLYNRK